MRFKAQLNPTTTFAKVVASLATLDKVGWLRLDDNDVRFTVMPEQGTQVWAQLSIDTIFETYTLQSAAEANTINLEVPLSTLSKALRSATTSTPTSYPSAAHIRLTKKEDRPTLSVTLTLTTPARAAPLPTDTTSTAPATRPDRTTTIVHDIAVKVLAPAAVSSLHEPHCRDPDVHITLPPLSQLKAVSDRFARLAHGNPVSTTSTARPRTGPAPRLALAATMHGGLRVALVTDSMRVRTEWRGLANPPLAPEHVEGGEEGVRAHPSTRRREAFAPGDERAWASVCVDARDWGRVLGVGRCAGRVIACFCHDHALILYVYLPNEDGADESVLTYYVTSYSA